MAVTLKDIAKKANVSISTVSRVINNDSTKPASKETSDKIWKIVNELGYVPNQSARNLIQGKDMTTITPNTKMLGCFYTSTEDTFNDPFFSQIGFGVQQEINSRDYILAFTLSTYKMSLSSLYNFITSNPVNGIIVMGRFDQDLLEFLKSNFKHIVYTGVNAVNGGFDEIICDGYKGAISAVDHLISQGNKRIGFIGDVSSTDVNHLINEHRLEGYLQALKNHNLEVDTKHIISTELNSSAAYNHMNQYLDNIPKSQLPEAFFCANDVTAIGAMKAIQEHKLEIPKDISIIGLDNIEMSSFVTPPLSTVNIPKEELGRTAVKTLIDQIESQRSYPLRIDLPYELIIRETSMKKIQGLIS